MWDENTVRRLIDEGKDSQNKKEAKLAKYLEFVFISFKYYEDLYMKEREKNEQKIS